MREPLFRNNSWRRDSLTRHTHKLIKPRLRGSLGSTLSCSPCHDDGLVVVAASTYTLFVKKKSHESCRDFFPCSFCSFCSVVTGRLVLTLSLLHSLSVVSCIVSMSFYKKVKRTHSLSFSLFYVMQISIHPLPLPPISLIKSQPFPCYSNVFYDDDDPTECWSAWLISAVSWKNSFVTVIQHEFQYLL